MATEDKRIDQLDPVSVLDLTSLIAMQQGTEAKKVTLQQLLDYLNGLVDAGNAVLFVSQNLSNAQKLQARANIGAAGVGDIPTGVVLYTDQTLTDAQKLQARTNIGAAAPGEGGGGSAEGAVLYTAQTLTAEQKEQARDNIGCGCHGYTDGKATGSWSSATGQGTEAASHHQFVIGMWNNPDPDAKYVFIVGNGTKPTWFVGELKNAHTLDWNGVPWYAGDRVMLGGTSMDDEAAVALMPVFVPQELTEEQKSQARANIGVDAYIEQVFLGGEW